MNLFCPECGYRMWHLPYRDAYQCGNCGAERSTFQLLEADAPPAAHGTQCRACQGLGNFEIEYTEWHPYGDTQVPEYLTDVEACRDCDGRGYHLDDRCCVVCGEPVDNGVLVEGWEVHEDCATEGVPTRETT